MKFLSCKRRHDAFLGWTDYEIWNDLWKNTQLELLKSYGVVKKSSHSILLSDTKTLRVQISVGPERKWIILSPSLKGTRCWDWKNPEGDFNNRSQMQIVNCPLIHEEWLKKCTLLKMLCTRHLSQLIFSSIAWVVIQKFVMTQGDGSFSLWLLLFEMRTHVVRIKN